MAYLVALSEDVGSCARRLAQLQHAYHGCLAELQGLVGEKASVPKEHVYPKFEACAVNKEKTRKERLCNQNKHFLKNLNNMTEYT